MIKGNFRGLFCLILWFLLGRHEGERGHTITWVLTPFEWFQGIPHSFHFQSLNLIETKILCFIGFHFVLWVLGSPCVLALFLIMELFHMCPILSFLHFHPLLKIAISTTISSSYGKTSLDTVEEHDI